MVKVECFCGELALTLEDLVTHTISSHTIKDKDFIDPIVFEMIETENKNAQLEKKVIKAKNKVNAENKLKYESMRSRIGDLPSINYKTPDPLSISKEEPSVVKATDTVKYPMPEDLQSLIIEMNPGRRARFTLSMRDVPELVLDDYVMKKKKGPWLNRSGGRAVAWKCTEPGCPYICSTLEGRVRESGDQGFRRHNHPPDYDALVRKEAKALMRKNMTSDTNPSQLVRDLLDSLGPQQRDSFGGDDGFKQLARRIKRKLKGEQQENKIILGDIRSKSQNKFKCNLCLTDFSLLHNLNKHKRNRHKENNPFHCSECKISFPTHDLHKKHLMNHSSEKYFSCNECGKSFKDNKYLGFHSVSHFFCKECKITFSTPESTREHKITHIGKTYFPCSKCSYSFSYAISLKRHMKGHAIKHANNSDSEKNNFDKRIAQKPLTPSQNENNETTETVPVDIKIKRPLNAYMVFSGQRRRMLSESGLSHSEISKELGRRWKELLQEEKVPYYQEADRLKEEHLRENPDYIYKPKRKPKNYAESQTYAGREGFPSSHEEFFDVGPLKTEPFF
jgi:hypothetical protein